LLPHLKLLINQRLHLFHFDTLLCA
jgi:hypothetical protein